MILIRLLGFAAGLYWLLSTVSLFARGRRSPTDLLLFGGTGAALMFLGVNPDALNRLLEALAFHPGQYGRIVGLLVFGLAFLSFLAWRQIDALREVDGEVTRLVQRLAIRDFDAAHPEGLKGPIAVLIPALNEGGVIRSVLKTIPREIAGCKVEVLVIDDGSEDDTTQAARASGAKVARHAMNRGGGAALGTGFRLARRSGLPYIVTIDADGQYRPEEIPEVLSPVLQGEADFVVGSRLLGRYEGWKDLRLLSRTVGLFLFNAAASLLLFRRVTDIPSGFRAFRTNLLESMTLRQKQFHTSEFLIEAVRSGARFREVPIQFLKRRVGESKKPPTLRYGWGFFKALFGTWWR